MTDDEGDDTGFIRKAVDSDYVDERDSSARTDFDVYSAEQDEIDRTRLDYSASSGPVGAGVDPMYGTEGVEFGANSTSWSKTDQERGTVKRHGTYQNKWDWLRKLNEKRSLDDWVQDNRDRARCKDFRVIATQIDNCDEHTKVQLYERAIAIYRQLRIDADNGLRVGNLPIETVELGIISYVARTLMDIDTFSQLDRQQGLHDVAFDGDQMATLRSDWTPSDTQATVDDMKAVRNFIREHV